MDCSPDDYAYVTELFVDAVMKAVKKYVISDGGRKVRGYSLLVAGLVREMVANLGAVELIPFQDVFDLNSFCFDELGDVVVESVGTVFFTSKDSRALHLYLNEIRADLDSLFLHPVSREDFILIFSAGVAERITAKFYPLPGVFDDINQCIRDALDDYLHQVSAGSGYTDTQRYIVSFTALDPEELTERVVSVAESALGRRIRSEKGREAFIRSVERVADEFVFRVMDLY
jgi:hypothetical protein